MARRKSEAVRRMEQRIREKKILRDVKKERSASRKVGKAFEGGYRLAQRGVTRTLYDRETPLSQRAKNITRTGGVKTGKRGRPRGSYDPRYAKYGGVYGYRKMLAQQNRLQRIQALRNASVTPRQQQVLRQIQARDQARRMSPEARTIPDTYGDVQLGGIMNEIKGASNILE